MLHEHPQTEMLAAYRRRSLEAVDLLAVDDHLAVCEACRVKVGQAEQLQAVFASLITALKPDAEASADHLSYDRFVSYVDGRMDAVDREIADAHFEICAACDETLRDLQGLKTNVPNEDSPAARWSGWRAWWSPYGALASAAAALLLVVTGLIIVQLVESMRETARVAAARLAESERRASLAESAFSELQRQSEAATIAEQSRELLLASESARQLSVAMQRQFRAERERVRAETELAMARAELQRETLARAQLSEQLATLEKEQVTARAAAAAAEETLRKELAAAKEKLQVETRVRSVRKGVLLDASLPDDMPFVELEPQREMRRGTFLSSQRVVIVPDGIVALKFPPLTSISTLQIELLDKSERVMWMKRVQRGQGTGSIFLGAEFRECPTGDYVIHVNDVTRRRTRVASYPIHVQNNLMQ